MGFAKSEAMDHAPAKPSLFLLSGKQLVYCFCCSDASGNLPSIEECAKIDTLAAPDAERIHNPSRNDN